MNRLDTVFRVEITEQEAENLAELLNLAVKEFRLNYESGDAAAYENLKAAREFRNAFGKLAGHTYMGADA